jgi:transposase InsO family protein
MDDEAQLAHGRTEHRGPVEQEAGATADVCRKHGTSGAAFSIWKAKYGEMEFLGDALSEGWRFRILAVVDDCSRECLFLVVDTSLSGPRVACQPDAIVAQRGRLLLCVSDNATEAAYRLLNAVFHLRSSSSNTFASSRSLVA